MCDMDDGELIVKTSSDCWVVGKRCDKREVYVVISHKNANLIEINGIIISSDCVSLSHVFMYLLTILLSA